MQNTAKTATAAVVAPQQTVAPYVPHSNTAARQLARIAAAQAKRASKNAARAQVAQQQAFMLAVQQAAAQYNVPVPVLNVKNAPNARANSATLAPSTQTVVVNGVAYKPCKAVHALCATLPANATRQQQLQLCYSKGINQATAQTQVAVYRKASAN